MTRAVIFAVFLLFCGEAGAQSAAASSSGKQAPAAALKPPPPNTAAATARADAPRAKISPLQEEADKLVDLARQLKTEVDKTNQDTLSLNMLRRAGEIDELAKSLEKQLQSAK